MLVDTKHCNVTVLSILDEGLVALEKMIFDVFPMITLDYWDMASLDPWGMVGRSYVGDH